MLDHYVLILDNVPRHTLKELRSLLCDISYDLTIDFEVTTNHLKKYACIDAYIPKYLPNKLLEIVSLLDAISLDKYVTEIKHDI
jgi:hypothetical protein